MMATSAPLLRPTPNASAVPGPVVSGGPMICATADAQRHLLRMALDHWVACSGDGQIPTVDDIDFNHPHLAPHFYVVHGGEEMADAMVDQGGSALSLFCGRDVLQQYLGDVLPRGLAGGRLEFFKAAARQEKPLADSGFHDRVDGLRLVFHQVAMPLRREADRHLVLAALCFRIEDTPMLRQAD